MTSLRPQKLSYLWPSLVASRSAQVRAHCAKELAPGCEETQCCDLCGQLQRRQMPDIENSRKNSRKGCRVGHGKAAKKQPEKHPKHPQNGQNSCFSGVSGVFPAVFRLFYRDPPGTLFGCFFGCFQCRAFGASVAGRRDRKRSVASRDREPKLKRTLAL